MADANLIVSGLDKPRGDAVKLASGTEDLVSATVTTVATGLDVVTAILNCDINTAAAKQGDGVVCIKSATAGSIVITAIGASGTTTVNWSVVGR